MLLRVKVVTSDFKKFYVTISCHASDGPSVFYIYLILFIFISHFLDWAWEDLKPIRHLCALHVLRISRPFLFHDYSLDFYVSFCYQVPNSLCGHSGQSMLHPSHQGNREFSLSTRWSNLSSRLAWHYTTLLGHLFRDDERGLHL